MPVYDTIIVGMGAAGCSAASMLCKAGKKVLGLEAQNRVGGRVNTVPFGDGVVELGAEWIHGERPSPVYDLALQNNVSILSQDTTFQVYKSDGSIVDYDLINDLVEFALNKVDDPPKDAEPLGQFLTREIKKYINEKHPTLNNDQDFIEQFLHFMDLVIDNYEASNSWNDVTTQSAYEDLEGDLHLSWHKHGYRTLFDILLNKYNNGPGFSTLDIQLEKEVTKISYPNNPQEDVTVTCKDGTTYRAKNVIVTVSLGVLKERYGTMFVPPLPDSKASIIDKMSIGLVDKIVLLFPYTWWQREPALIGFLWKEKDRSQVDKNDAWVTKVFGVSSPLGSEKALTLWTSGCVGKMVETLPDEVVKRKSMELIRRFLGKNRTIPEPTAMLRSNWFSNPYTRGSYTYDNVQTPLHPNARSILAEPLTDNSGAPRVLFAGEATNSIHFSTVHGAVETGYREAYRLLPKGKL